MDDRDPPEAFTDVNEAVSEEWAAETTPSERVRAVVARTYSPVSADAVADEARTSPKTARKHLEALAREGFVTTEPGEYGATTYRRSPESLVVEQAAALLERRSTDELAERIETMRERLADYRAEFGVESPEALTVDRTNRALADDSATDADDSAAATDADDSAAATDADDSAAATDADDSTGSTTDAPDPETIREWKTLRRNLAFANAALSIGHAEAFVDGDGSVADRPDGRDDASA